MAPRLYDFDGSLPYIEAAVDLFQLPRRLAAKIATAAPLTIAARVLAGLSEISRRASGRPFQDAELASVRQALDDIVEVPWHYRTAAGVATSMLGDGWSTLHSFEAGSESVGSGDAIQPPPFAGVGQYLSTERERLELHELIADRVRHVPELGSIARRIGHVHNGLRNGTMSVEAARPELDCVTEEARVLSVLADAAEAMVADAFRAFGFKMPDTPPPGRPESRCCAANVYRQRARAKTGALFFA